MKKIILLLAIFISTSIFSVYAEGKKQYSVVVETELIYTYNPVESGKGSQYEICQSGGSQTILIYADNKYEAEQDAIEECSTMCQRSLDKYEGTKKGNGGYMYKVYSTRRVTNATATEMR